MMSRFGCVVGLAVVGILGTAPFAAGQGIVTQWNFNSGTPDGNVNTGSTTPGIGSGTASAVGPVSSAFGNGLADAGSTDPTGSDNSGWQFSTFAPAGTGNGTRGNRFDVNTSAASNLVFRFDQRHSGGSNRFAQVEYTTNNGSSWTALAVFTANLGLGNTWYNNRTVDLSGIAGVSTSQFGIRIVSVFDPNGSDYVGTSAAYDDVNGIWRFDAVTLAAMYVWQGGSGTALATGANYAGGNAPGSTGTVMFGPAGGANTSATTAAGGTTLDQIVFRGAAPAYTISGTGTLTLTAGLVNSTSNTQAITAPVAFGQSNTIQNTGGKLVFGGNTAFTNYLVLQGGGQTLFTSGTTITGSLAAGTTNNPTPATVRVAPGAVLGVNGTGTVTVATASVQLFSGSNSNGTLRVEATRTGGNGVTGTANAGRFDLTAAAAVFNLNPGSGNKFTIDLVNGTTGLQAGESYTITLATVLTAGNIQLNGASQAANTTIAGSNYVLQSSDFSSFTGVSLGVDATGRNLILTFTPVPEPGSVLGLAGGVLWLGAVARRRIRRDAGGSRTTASRR